MFLVSFYPITNVVRHFIILYSKNHKFGQQGLLGGHMSRDFSPNSNSKCARKKVSTICDSIVGNNVKKILNHKCREKYPVQFIPRS